MHRDVRLTLQCLLERVDLHLLFKSDSPGKSRNRFLHEKRSRLHFWIGDWYHKAFLSSGHLTPVIESLHHRVMAALYSPHSTFKTSSGAALPKDEVYTHRVALLESSLLEAQKTLYAAWNAMKLWQASPFEVSWLGEASRKQLTLLFKGSSASSDQYAVIPRICSYFKRNKEKQRENAERLNTVFDSFLTCLESLDKEMLLDGGGIGGGMHHHCRLRLASHRTTEIAVERRGPPLTQTVPSRSCPTTGRRFNSQVGCSCGMSQPHSKAITAKHYLNQSTVLREFRLRSVVRISENQPSSSTL